MSSLNPYSASEIVMGVDRRKRRQDLLLANIVFSSVLAVAVVAGAVAPGVAHFAGAPRHFTVTLLQISMAMCVPFGICVAYVASRCSLYQTKLSSICWFFAVFLILVPLSMYSRTAGPLVGYTGFAMLLTILAGLTIASVARRITRHRQDEATSYR